MPAMLDLVISCTVTLTLQGILHLGLWSLLVGRLSGFTANYASIWILAQQRPRMALSRVTAIKLYSFGWPVLVSGIANYLVIQGDSLAVSYFCGPERLAYYTLAFSMPFYLREFSDILSSSLLPAYSYLRESRELTIAAFLQTNRFLQLLILPCSVALVTFAGPVITFVYGPKWLASIPLLRLLALAFTVQMSCGYTWGILCLAWGKVKYLMAVKLWLVLFFFVAALPLIRHYGTMGGACYTLAAAVLTVGIVRFFILYKELGNAKFLTDSLAPLAASGAAALVFTPIAGRYIAGLISFAFAVLAYFLAYFFFLVILDNRVLSELSTLASEFKESILSRKELHSSVES
jgi:O-antigen/teichoic acid export membrane protein